jgi:sigma-B regulation protein RsbU (phosphoserine phosphatase)
VSELSHSRILIVDDVKANADVLVSALEGSYRLSVALSGELALKAAERTPIDLVLLDVVMPGLDGLEVCRRLRARPEMKETPILFLSSLDEAQRKVEGFEAGGTDYLTKPVEVRELRARVRSHLKAKAYSDAVKATAAAEMRVAREIQLGMLRQDLAGIDPRGRVEVRALLEPAREVGGDLFHAELLEDGVLFFAVGDVAGKGVPAALTMAVTLTILKGCVRFLREPARVLARINDDLAANNPSSMFVTLLCGLLDTATGRLTLASAGHPPPLLLPLGGAPRWTGLVTGTLAGIEPSLPQRAIAIQLAPGDRVLAFTDGVTEAMNEQGQLFGEARLLAAAASSAPGAQAVLDAVGSAVRAFAGATPQSDDIALLAVQFLGAGGAA